MTEKKKTVLVVDDDVPILDIMAQTLEEAGFRVLKAENGVRGLSLALTKNPDLILLDIIMPKMDGLTMLSKLRANKRGKKTPVIILTNLNDMESAAEVMKKGVHDFLVKTDWKLADVVKKVKEKLS